MALESPIPHSSPPMPNNDPVEKKDGNPSWSCFTTRMCLTFTTSTLATIPVHYATHPWYGTFIRITDLIQLAPVPGTRNVLYRLVPSSASTYEPYCHVFDAIDMCEAFAKSSSLGVHYVTSTANVLAMFELARELIVHGTSPALNKYWRRWFIVLVEHGRRLQELALLTSSGPPASFPTPPSPTLPPQPTLSSSTPARPDPTLPHQPPPPPSPFPSSLSPT